MSDLSRLIKPLAIVVVVLLLMIFGVIGLRQIPIQLTPTVDQPVVSITTRWFGRSPQEVEQEILEEQGSDAAESDPRSAIAAACRRAVEEETGEVPRDVGFTGITDARFYLNDAQIPTVILGPGSLAVAHTANEWVEVDALAAAARVYARIFVGFLGA